MEIYRIDQQDRERVDAFIVRRWFGLRMAVHGELFDLGHAEGFYTEEDGEVTGLVTYRAEEDFMEILSMDSVREGRGTGTALLRAAAAEARAMGCRRITLITTNDNTPALRFWQKRGFDIVALHRGAVAEARALKPEIPVAGLDGIPLRHEIELEMDLREDPEKGAGNDA